MGIQVGTERGCDVVNELGTPLPTNPLRGGGVEAQIGVETPIVARSEKDEKHFLLSLCL